MPVGISDPDRGGQGGGEAYRPVVTEILRRAGLGGHVPAGQREVATAAEFHAPVAVIRHDRVDDERDLLTDGPELIMGRVVIEFRIAKAVLNMKDRGGSVAQAERRQR